MFEINVTHSKTNIAESLKKNSRIPRHVGIIMDGNGRWAKKRDLPRTDGHKAGIESVRAVVKAAGELGVKAVTLYTFSCENWNRPKSEVSALMTLLLQTIRKEIDELNSQNVRLMTIGNIDALPYAPRMGIKNTIKRLSKNTGLVLNLALSYSSRQEILFAVQQIGKQIQEGTLEPDEISEDTISHHLQTV